MVLGGNVSFNLQLLFPREAELASASEAFTGGDDSRLLTGF